MKKALVVDDMTSWRNFHYDKLSKLYGDSVDIDICDSATSAYNKIIERNSDPYDIVITDLQMEGNYAPKYAGVWLVEQIKTLPKYYKTKIIIISSSSGIRIIAKNLGVDCIPKSTSISVSDYSELLEY